LRKLGDARKISRMGYCSQFALSHGEPMCSQTRLNAGLQAGYFQVVGYDRSLWIPHTTGREPSAWRLRPITSPMVFDVHHVAHRMKEVEEVEIETDSAGQAMITGESVELRDNAALSGLSGTLAVCSLRCHILQATSDWSSLSSLVG
jgi:hypothetical protein